ncbi:hypothetical protein B0H66DRAFT_74729 [Apodospora peruviana]|uniref:Zn(2)-C6 fungal-type domain-containing protein n=1 Tax=Apodospora peruviana TaxID=516989 RepID=A0AAE0MFY1_9PEZI|nr:hypothetical protein B0H66DRAFT_74729 [Apodospora peruviana]
MSDLPSTPITQASNSGPPGPSPGSSLRKERGAIAAQACDTCRSRKQRCDEKRPKCSTCLRFKLDCNYREPQPTKKDKTLVEILDRIKSLENKIDSLNIYTNFPSTTSFGQPGTYVPATSLVITSSIHAPAIPTSSTIQFPEPSSATSGTEDHYTYVSSVHQMLAWPAVQQLLATVQPKVPSMDLSSVERDAPMTTLGAHNRSVKSLPSTTALASRGQGPEMSVHGPALGPSPISVSGLNWDTMQRLSKAYFDSINLVYPILDRHSFFSDILPSLFNDGFGQGMASTIAFLVFALGEVALAGSEGHPIHAHNGRPSGVKGGSKDEPPGLDLFNEARKRMGFNLTECSLENVQIFALASLYYGTCFHLMDFWRMTTSASLACQALITSNPGELSSPRVDLVRRAFWHCSIMETCLNLELGFPLTGLEKMENVVGLPDFAGPYSEDDYITNQESHFQEHFASQIVLRRLLVDFHGVLSQTASTPTSLGSTSSPFSPTTTTGTGLNRMTIQGLALQLDQWRGMLPPHLKWQEESPGAFPEATQEEYHKTNAAAAIFSPAASAPLSPVMSTSQPHVSHSTSPTPPLMFTTDLDAPPVRYPYTLDIQVALLRSRYYYTKYLIHRPFIYKALHAPDAMTHDDAAGAAECLKSCLKWPLAMSPTCQHKRLIPCHFFFSQNFLGILVLLHLSTTVPILRRIRTTLCGDRFEMDARETVGLYTDWLRDLKSVDGVARWHWELVKAIYGLEE